MTYMSDIKKYIICVSTPTYTPFTNEEYNTYFLESDYIGGPYNMISYLEKFGAQAYFVNIPSKFWKGVKNGIMEGFLSYSANFDDRKLSNPPGSGYWWSLQ